MEDKLEDRLDKIIKNLENKKAIEFNLKNLFDKHINNKQLITQYDILGVLGISLTTYNNIQVALRRPETTKVEVEKIQYILEEVNSLQGTLSIINDKAIKSGARISKNTMAYILKNETEDKELVVINVEVEKGERLSLSKLLDNERNKP